MSIFNINVKCFKTYSDRLSIVFFETRSKLKLGLLLYDVYTLTREYYKDLLSSSNSAGYIFELKVECNDDYIIGKTKIPSSI